MRLVAFLIATSAVAHAQERATLFHSLVDCDEVLLPASAWQPVDASLAIDAERAFHAEVRDGGDLWVDADRDGACELRVHALEQTLVLKGRGESGPGTYAVSVRNAGRRWEWSSAGCLVARVDGTRLRLFDLDGNGSFADFGRDAIILGAGRTAVFLSRVVTLRGELKELQLVDGAREVVLSDFEGPTGFVDACSGFACTGRLAAAVVRDGELSFDLAASGSSVELPVGSYELVSGLAETSTESVRIRTGRMAPIGVTPDALVSLAWGAPVVAEFDFEVSDDRIRVEPDVGFFGRGGEEYWAFHPIAKSPRITVHDRASGELVQSGRFGGCCGGGLSRFEASVPPDRPLDVRLEHERSIFGQISGRPRSAKRRNGLSPEGPLRTVRR